MSETLYLIQSRAQRDYRCPACQRIIRGGEQHFRHDPFPAAKIHRGVQTTHWCFECISRSPGAIRDGITGRIRMPIVNVQPSQLPRDSQQDDLPLFRPLRVEFIEVGNLLLPKLCDDPALIYQLTPDQFEEFICERLFVMGLEPQRTGNVNARDGGIDIVFWPRQRAAFPFLGAAQVKHHKRPSIRESASTVRDFSGAIAAHPFNAGLLVTNSSFSPDAEWFAREHAKLLRLRDFSDIQRWLFDNFSAEAEWREIPRSIELCPGTVVTLRGPSGRK